MARNEHKKETFEDKFARKYYCNSYRFNKKVKKANNKKFRRINKIKEEEYVKTIFYTMKYNIYLRG